MGEIPPFDEKSAANECRTSDKEVIKRDEGAITPEAVDRWAKNGDKPVYCLEIWRREFGVQVLREMAANQQPMPYPEESDSDVFVPPEYIDVFAMSEDEAADSTKTFMKFCEDLNINGHPYIAHLWDENSDQMNKKVRNFLSIALQVLSRSSKIPRAYFDPQKKGIYAVGGKTYELATGFVRLLGKKLG